jgi:hypothetical protein
LEQLGTSHEDLDGGKRKRKLEDNSAEAQKLKKLENQVYLGSLSCLSLSFSFLDETFYCKSFFGRNTGTSSVSDLHRLYADPGPAFKVKADPDPALKMNVVPCGYVYR